MNDPYTEELRRRMTSDNLEDSALVPESFARDLHDSLVMLNRPFGVLRFAPPVQGDAPPTPGVVVGAGA